MFADGFGHKPSYHIAENERGGKFEYKQKRSHFTMRTLKNNIYCLKPEKKIIKTCGGLFCGVVEKTTRRVAIANFSSAPKRVHQFLDFSP